ncbi:MAG TPA: cytochrome c3 family protein [Methylomirabilota bacterium]|nr:cytochrome c3 family protein [Methylomirabilota bacterium]
MRLPAVVLVLAAALAAAPLPAPAQTAGPAGPPSAPGHPSPSPGARPDRAQPPHRPGELDCRKCHLGGHQGIVQMYIGIGGRGAPTIPSHMFQVRVECIACHTTPKTPDGAGGLGGQTFRPSEQACVTCHGEKYRGMLGQWTTTLARMTEIVAAKLRETRLALQAADRRDPKSDRARVLVDDAEFNNRYVGLAKGVHNVFYAADLLKLGNGWLDEANTLLRKPPMRTDDQLVRGGYCAVLCHQAAGVKPRETVTFGRQKVPHARHVTDFGATCTSCHSAETHKAVTATAVTCSSCHHSPQNERCESCHARQAAFYRGRAKSPDAQIAPNRMAEAVTCTGCHDFTRKHSRTAVTEKCLGCHEPAYLPLMTEWTTGFDRDLKATAEALRAAESAAAQARRTGRAKPAAEALLEQAREAHALVRSSTVVHNPLAADALLAAARRKATEARAQLGR